MARFEEKETVNFKKMYRKQYKDIAVADNNKYTPEQLFEFAVEYFQWAEENLLRAAETASFQGNVSEHKVHKARVFTWKGFQLFASVTNSMLDRYKKTPGYMEVVEFIANVIYEQKYQLAANGIINANMVARDLGIDKSGDVNVTASATSVSGSVTQDDFKDALRDVLGEIGG